VDDDGLWGHLRYLANEAAQPLIACVSMHYEVTGHGPYELFEEGHHLAALEGPEDVLYVLYQRCHARLVAHQSRAGWTVLHAAVLSVTGRRTLVLGPKGAGKTTLMLRLLHDGHPVEGDEAVFTRDGEAICLPRNFHVKSGTAPLIPELSAGWAGWPRVSTSDGTIITAFNPASAGFSWQLERGPISVAFVLRANHAGAPSCRPLSSLEMIEAALANCRPTGVSAAEVVRACCSLLGAVRAYELTVGDVAQTAGLLVATALDDPPLCC
jgi:hypothetical protein